MKMPDGGFRPAYNVQFAAETQHGLVAGVAVTPRAPIRMRSTLCTPR